MEHTPKFLHQMKKIVQILFISSLLLAFLQVSSQENAGSAGPLPTIATFTCISSSNDSILLKTNITVKKEGGNTNLMNAAVRYSVTGKDGDENLAAIKTDVNGNAVFQVPSARSYFRNAAGLVTFKAVFEGTPKYESSKGEFALKPAKLKISFFKADTIKTIKVEGIQYEADGSQKPLAGQSVILFIPSLFSPLKIAEVTIDSTGSGTTEFPSGLIGDTSGNIKIIARIDENEVYGNVSGESSINWAAPKHLISAERPSRELWTPIAPLWMIITLITMLTGVWGHYTYAIVQLVKIRNAGNRHKAEQARKDSEAKAAAEKEQT
jgi:hypothetical protein